MIDDRWRRALGLGLAVLLCCVGPAALPPSGGQAAAVGMPPRPTATQTPTPPAPGPSPIPSAVPALPTRAPGPVASDGPAGAWIELRALPVDGRQGLWAAVQWQDSAGRWHDVAGWQGIVAAPGGREATQEWWLGEALFGRGPFRWAVYAGPAGARLGTSEPFFLPEQPGDTRLVVVTLRR